MWLGGQSVAILGTVVKLYVSMAQRVTRVETMLELLGRTAAKDLHSPHTPELDALLDKYIDRHYELSYDEWQKLLELCNKSMEEETNVRKATCAEFLAAICHHKLRHTPPKRRNQNESGPSSQSDTDTR